MSDGGLSDGGRIFTVDIVFMNAMFRLARVVLSVDLR